MKFDSFILITWLYIDNYICIHLVYWADPDYFPWCEKGIFACIGKVGFLKAYH